MGTGIITRVCLNVLGKKVNLAKLLIHTECVMDLDSRLEVIIFESILNTIELSVIL